MRSGDGSLVDSISTEQCLSAAGGNACSIHRVIHVINQLPSIHKYLLINMSAMF